MTLFHLLLLAGIQGITEFLPVSSSGHLILFPQLTGQQDQGQVIDVAVHVGTLAAVVLYFWSDVRIAALGLPKVLRWQIDDQGSWLALCLIISTIPVVILGLAFKLTGIDEALRSVAVIGWTMLVFGIVLYWADMRFPQSRRAEEWSLRHALVMGLWQALALIPGTSRSGITITGARALGYDRTSAARLAMLMSIPTILASGMLLGAEVVAEGDWSLAREAGIAAAFAFFCALLALWGMMRLLTRVSYTPYVIYRVILGTGLLVWAYTGG